MFCPCFLNIVFVSFLSVNHLAFDKRADYLFSVLLFVCVVVCMCYIVSLLPSSVCEL